MKKTYEETSKGNNYMGRPTTKVASRDDAKLRLARSLK